MVLLWSILFSFAIAGGLENAILAAHKAHQAQQAFDASFAECPYSEGGLHVITVFVNNTLAADVCRSMGYQLAALTDSNYLYAVNVNQKCGPNDSKWIASFNGLNTDPCMYLDQLNGVKLSIGSAACLQNMNVMCQDVPVIVHSETVTVTDTLTSGTVTLSTTITRHPTTAPCHHKAEAILEHGNCASSCKDCDSFVDVPRSNLKIIKTPTTFERAAAACAKHGWSLADVTDGMHRTLLRGQQALKDSGSPSAVNLWIRSFDGVSGGRCLAVNAGEFGMLVTFGLTAQRCALRGITFPLCQCGNLLPTGFGPYQGSTTTTTTTVTTEIEETIPETTTATTETVCQHCRRPHVDSSSSSSSSSSSRRHRRRRHH